MTAEELEAVMRRWGLNAAELAKVLCVHSNRMSEYLGGVTRIPCSLAFSVEALELLDPDRRQALLERRKARRPHER